MSHSRTPLHHLPWFLGLMLASCAGMAREPDAAPAPRFADPALTEASGMAVSPTAPEFLWLINDSGNPPRLHLADRLGRARGGVDLEGARNIDWEDLAAFRWNRRGWLLIADVGDNAAARETVRLHLVPEPDLPEDGQILASVARIARTIEFRYPDGPRDCEAVAVDAGEGSVLLLTKREERPRLYRLPLEVEDSGGLRTAEFVGETTPPTLPPGGIPHPFGRQPTGMDLSGKGRIAAVVTYQGVHVILRREGEGWGAAFARPWEAARAHGLPQAEAIALDPEGREVLVTSEGAGPRLLRFPLE